jgi:hypothetical protein
MNARNVQAVAGNGRAQLRRKTDYSTAEKPTEIASTSGELAGLLREASSSL